MLVVLSLAAGAALLFLGGEGLIRGAVALAERLRVSRQVVGLTVVGFGTSMPELFVSVQAGLTNRPDLAVGNVIGSNIANILLILGASALIRPLAVTARLIFKEGLVMVAAALAGAGLILAGQLDRWAGLVVGSQLFVQGASGVARGLGVSEAVIGLSLVAVGTSLPELTTSLLAAWHNRADLAAGNIIGSNIFNTLGILGAAATISPLAVNPAMAALDIWVMLGASLLLLPLLATGRRLNRLEGGLLLAAYAGYIALLYAGWPAGQA